MSSTHLLLGDARVTAPMERDVRDPWTREAFAVAPWADASHAERAISIASAAFPRTKGLSAYVRRDVCLEVARLLRERREALATTIAREVGKPIGLARIEVERAAGTFAIAADVATRPVGEVVPLDLGVAHARHAGSYVRVPKGPVLAFSPFNFPLNLVAHKVAPALACGAPVVLKPAPKAPLTALALAEIVREAGAPAGAFTVVPCDDAVAERLVRDERFAVLSFTGSAKVGYMLKALAGKKHVVLELGGNAAAIVHDDVHDASHAADAVTTSAFAYAGQVCISTQRVYVHHARYEAFVAELVTRAAKLTPEEPVSAAGILGPVVDEGAASRITTWIGEAEARGAVVLHRGARDENRMGTVVLREPEDTRGLRVVEEEAFGPVVTVCPYATLDEAFAKVNASRYGLQAAIFTDSTRVIDAAYATLDVGGLVVNDSPSFRSDAMPYGGTKDSGLGREGVAFAVNEYTAPKVKVVRAG